MLEVDLKGLKIKILDYFKTNDNIINPSVDIEREYQFASDEIDKIYIDHDKYLSELTYDEEKNVQKPKYKFPQCDIFLSYISQNKEITKGLRSKLTGYDYVEKTNTLLQKIG